ncbi:hypothetical protein BDV93DRAFT_554871 [Ceratobasidium sp. AG-I]|nr:hypothetical protein BDV93DRAFT_554871 [Ceratobasidium sp. AG-I]
MRRILGLTRSDDKQRGLLPPTPKPTTYLSRASAALRASESTPALVHHIPDSSSSSGIRTPSDTSLLAVPGVHPASTSSDSVARSARSSKSARWLPASLIRTLSRKRRPPPRPPTPPPQPAAAIDHTDDASSDSLSTDSSRPRSPPLALLPPPAPPFAAASSRRASSPASSIYRAGLAQVQRRAPPSRANIALHNFTHPLVLAASAPTPHPLLTPNSASPAVFPRSVSRARQPPSHSLCIQVHRARVLRRLEEGALTAAEETSIMPFTARAPRSPAMPRRVRPSATEDAVAELDGGTGRWSRGLRRWVARPMFEDRVSVYCPSPELGNVSVDIVRSARGLGTETLDFSDGTLAMAGLALDGDGDSDSELSPLPAPQAIKPLVTPLQIQITPATRRMSLQPPSLSPSPSSPGTGTGPGTPRTMSPLGGLSSVSAGEGKGESMGKAAVRGVRFADAEEDEVDSDDLPLAVLVAVQKKRAEREARAKRQRVLRGQAQTQTQVNPRPARMGEEGEREGRRSGEKRRSYADEISRARQLQDAARAGTGRPASFVRDAEAKRQSVSPTRPASTATAAQHRRRNTVGEAGMSVSVSGGIPPPLPTIPAGFSTSASSPLTPGSANSNSGSGNQLSAASFSGFPASPSMPGLPSSAPSTLPSFAPFPSPSGSGFSHSHSSPHFHSNLSSPSGSMSSLPGVPVPPFAARSISSSPLRSSFALGPDEFGVTGGAGGNSTMGNNMMTNNLMMAGNPMMNNSMMANNSMFANNAMAMVMGLPNPMFAASAGGSGTGSRGRSSAYGSANGGGSRSQSQARSTENRRSTVGPGSIGRSTGSQGGNGRPGPSPMQQGGSSVGVDRRNSVLSEQGRSNVPGSTRRGGHAHSKSETARRPSKLGASLGMAPPLPAISAPSVPTGIYSARGRVRPGPEVVS